VAVNCAALPEALLESELFGHVKGAFSGATSARAGLFVEADRGTIFLDEIGEMSPALQEKLLHVLEGGEVRALGASKARTVDVRVVTATHRDLKERVRAGAFREDLYYRLDVVTIELPALRHRREDIPLLVEQFLRAARERHPQATIRRIGAAALARLIDYAWPGNVRELEHATTRIVLLAKGEEAQVSDLPPAIASFVPSEAPPIFTDVMPVRELQRRYAAWALEKMGGHKTRTAERLGIDLKTLSKWLSDDER
jgi:two-component system response regulator HydG